MLMWMLMMKGKVMGSTESPLYSSWRWLGKRDGGAGDEDDPTAPHLDEALLREAREEVAALKPHRPASSSEAQGGGHHHHAADGHHPAPRTNRGQTNRQEWGKVESTSRQRLGRRSTTAPTSQEAWRRVRVTPQAPTSQEAWWGVKRHQP